ncbi:MAG: GNAT family N-acetyltransferase [Deltaproteobacteria bacterium]|nr:GNAT family N-acetyltransferase [Deltaproteobacteria bacterium]
MEYVIDKNITVRFAHENESGIILQFIKELAEFEKLPDHVTATQELIHKSIFINKRAEVLFCEYKHEIVGFALFFHNYSTFLAKPGLYLEDLYVKPEFRSRGIGMSFFNVLSKIARERNCGRIEWWCLNWNKKAIDFYLKLGAKAMDEWIVYRVTEDKFDTLEKKTEPALPA